jgi:arylsulfatase A-like enzyme
MKTFALAALLSAAALPAAAQPHNVIIFVADGLRSASVTPDVAPTLARLRHDGVDFANSHSLYPTVTTANASAIATGHYLGDTGDYANVLYTGFPVAAAGGSSTPFLEHDGILKELKAHFADGYMGPETLLCAAARAGYSAAAIGKAGPVAIQAINCLDKVLVLDDATGHPTGPDGAPSGTISVDPAFLAGIKQATGVDVTPAPALPNVAQQTWFADVATKAVLPAFQAKQKPFVLLFWSRDPDATQHAQADSVGGVVPGINGPASKAAISNADVDLTELLDALKALGLDSTTDVFVTADHGFSTIAKSVPDAGGKLPPPSHPPGFLAIDVANWLGAKIFDPDAGFQALDLASGEHPLRGNGIIGESADAPEAVVAANGGTDFIYAPGAKSREHAKTIFVKLLEAPYVGSLFVNDELLRTGDPKAFAGALPLSSVHLAGSATLPQPAIVVGFRSFIATGCQGSNEICAVELADTSLQTGQGMHGSFSRADTHNFMAAIGPDFKAGFVDPAPVSNADIAPTLAHILELKPLSAGNLEGRVASEALVGGKKVKVHHRVIRAPATPDGTATVLDVQSVGRTDYFDAAGIPGRVVGVKQK